MFCTKCGQQLADQDRFCVSCGTAVDQNATQPSQEPTADPTPEAAGEKDTVRKCLLTEEIILQSFKIKSRSVANYIIKGICIFIFSVLGLVFTVLGIVVAVACWGAAIAFAIKLIVDCHKERKYKTFKYTIIERTCVKKEAFIDADTSEHWLYFENPEKTGCLRYDADDDYQMYKSTQIGEMFYLVFPGNSTSEFILFPQKTWVLDENMLRSKA